MPPPRANTGGSVRARSAGGPRPSESTCLRPNLVLEAVTIKNGHPGFCFVFSSSIASLSYGWRRSRSPVFFGAADAAPKPASLFLAPQHLSGQESGQGSAVNEAARAAKEAAVLHSSLRYSEGAVEDHLPGSRRGGSSRRGLVF